MKFFKRRYIIIFAIILLIVATLVVISRRNKEAVYETVNAIQGDINQEVEVSGRVRPVDTVDLAFAISGKVETVTVKIGDQVALGDTLASLEQRSLIAEREQARAELASAEAGLNLAETSLRKERVILQELERGTREEELAVQQTKVANAEASYEESLSQLRDAVRDTYTKSDDAIRNQVDQLFSNPRTSPELNFNIDQALENVLEEGRSALEPLLVSWQASLSTLHLASDLTIPIGSAIANINTIRDYLDTMSLAVNNLTASSDLTQATIDGWKTDISTGRTNVASVLTALARAEDATVTTESAWRLAESELTLLESGTLVEKITTQEIVIEGVQADIERQKALIRKARADIDLTGSRFAESVLTSPIAGIVSQRNLEIGEIVSANTPILSIVSEDQFEIEVFIPEADIAKVNVGDEARVALDAFGDDDQLMASVVFIDPTETEIEGVSTYRTTLVFVDEEHKVRSGMTADLDIVTDTRSSVITIPFRAVVNRAGEKIVRIPSVEGTFVERPVTTGIRGADGSVEIIDGLQAGETVILFIRD